MQKCIPVDVCNNNAFFLNFYFIFKLYIIVLILPNIKMNPPQVMLFLNVFIFHWKIIGLLWWLSGKESACSVGDKGDVGSVPVLGRSLWEGKKDKCFTLLCWVIMLFNIVKFLYRYCYRALIVWGGSKTMNEVILQLKLILFRRSKFQFSWIRWLWLYENNR